MSARTFVLVDCASTLTAAHKAGWLAHGSTAVAISKYGVQACHEAGVPYVLIDEFYRFDELIARSLGTYDRLERFCDSFDRTLWTWHDDLRARLRPFSYAYYELKILVDTVSTKLFQLRRFLTNHEGIRLVYRKAPLSCDAIGGWAFDERRNLFGELLEAAGTRMCASVTLQPILARASAEVPPIPPRSVTARVRQWARSFAGALVRTRARRPKAEFVLFATGGHDVKYLLPALAQRGLMPIRIPARDRPAAERRAPFADSWRRLCADEAFVGFFADDGVSYFPLVRSRLQHLVTELTPASVDAYESTAMFLKRPRLARFALTSVTTVSVEDRGRMRACQDAGLRVVAYQEGAGFGSVVHPMNDYAEMTDGDDFFCYGDGNIAYHDALAAAGRPVKRFHVIGSAEQDHVRDRVRARTPPPTVRSIMYVGTQVATNRLHHPFNGSTDTVYADVQLAMFTALERLASRVTVRVKPHPADLFPRRHFVRAAPQVEVLDGFLEDHLGDTDLFIVDFPSTVLLTCLQTSAHVFVLAEPRMTMLTEAQRRSLEKRAFVFSDTADLVRALDLLAADGFFMPHARTDDDYACRYGTYLGDGRSAERAVSLLEKWNSA